jgi:hypothetical protein
MCQMNAARLSEWTGNRLAYSALARARAIEEDEIGFGSGRKEVLQQA